MAAVTTALGSEKLVLASNNPGKIQEFKSLLATLNLEVIAQGELNIPPAPEPYPTFIENALNKARHASKLSGLPALADDSGICAAALNNQPGIHSSRFAEAEPNQDNNAKLNSLLHKETDKTVFYYCCLILIRQPADPAPVIAEGKWFGLWTESPRGKFGFGYDPHFYLPALGKTAGELPPARKNALSHRALAAAILLAKLSR